jgi:hypothetical protein
MATFGNTNIGGSSTTAALNLMAGGIFTLSDNSASVSKLTIRVSGGTGGNIKGVIYNYDGSAPSSLVAVTSAVSIAASQPAGWVDFSFASPPSLNAGSYFLGFVANNGGTRFYYAATGGNRFNNLSSNYTSPPDPFGTVTTHDSLLWSIYATYTVTPTSTAPVGLRYHGRGRIST